MLKHLDSLFLRVIYWKLLHTGILENITSFFCIDETLFIVFLCVYVCEQVK